MVSHKAEVHIKVPFQHQQQYWNQESICGSHNQYMLIIRPPWTPQEKYNREIWEHDS